MLGSCKVPKSVFIKDVLFDIALESYPEISTDIIYTFTRKIWDSETGEESLYINELHSWYPSHLFEVSSLILN